MVGLFILGAVLCGDLFQKIKQVLLEEDKHQPKGFLATWQIIYIYIFFYYGSLLIDDISKKM